MINKYQCTNCEMTYWSPFSLTECVHCGGFLARAYLPTDVPSTVAVMRNEMEEQIVQRSMDDIMSGFEQLLRGDLNADQN